ncbi:Phage capsid family protein [Paracoccus haematequi]|uniref:Phage capsid family protein n=1 Tax=Paracoccus haematequi TaxID=2491866 RepID=A0A3S4DUJ8_9RHOB|nr:phage major capsid protein [Paracoccus haematequi]VDS07572.1 Phage capsid family protein [Paracoccus haematequi]
MENRAYSVLEIKAVDDDAREIRGIATTPAPDRVQDVVVPEGAKFALPLPLLWQHDASQPIGHVTEATVTAKGIEVVAKIAKGVDAEIDRAWNRIKAGLVRGLSIGFRGLESEDIPGSWGRKFTSWEWMELSAVTIPANAEASILAVKQYDTEQRAASGQNAVGSEVGASAVPVKSANGDKQMSKKTFAEQISAFEATRAAKSARMAELMDASAESGETLDAEGAQEYDDLKGEVKSIDEHLNRLRDMEKLAVKSAADVTNATTTKASEGVRTVAAVKGNNLPKGTAFTRYAMALMAGKGNLMQSAEIAKRWDDTPQVETVLKAAVAAGTTTDTNWAKPLVEYSNMASEFAELLRPATILGRIDGLRRVPFNIKVPRQTGGASASWVGEGAPKPVSSLAFDSITLGHTKVAGIVVMTEELVRFSNPAAEDIVRRDLVETIGGLIDKDFVDPAKAAVSGVSPASITNGVTPVVASGTSADHLRADVQALMAKFITANMSLSGAVWIMTETQALAIAMLLNPLGQPEFPGLSISGGTAGTFFGIPVILSENIPAQSEVTGPPAIPAGSRIILAKASEIMLADDGQVMLDASNQASLQMDSEPTNPPTATTVMVSLWQMNMVGIRAERFINWTKRRAGAVQYITGAAYA